MQQRKEHKAQLGDRKSLVAQQRMKAITNMASEVPSSKAKKRKKKELEHTFGANDEDWAIYREIVGSLKGLAIGSDVLEGCGRL